MGAMTMLRAALVSLVFATTSAYAANDNQALVSQVTTRLAQMKGVRAQFTQTQTLSAMKQPLVSTGTLVFQRERGVIWRVDTPYAATYVITDAGVVQVDSDGRRVRTKSAQGVRGVAQVSKMMRAMLGGDLSALYSQFDVDARGSASDWTLDLKPNQPQLAQAISGLHMTGGAFLRGLRIDLANGDATRIDFVKTEAVDGLAPAERILLSAP